MAFELSSGMIVEFCGLCGYSASLSEETNEKIPFDTPEGVSMLLGMTVNLFDKNDNLVEELPKGATIKVSFPMGAKAEDLLGIQLWNPMNEEWGSLIDLFAIEGQFEAFIDWPGTLPLVE